MMQAPATMESQQLSCRPCWLWSPLSLEGPASGHSSSLTDGAYLLQAPNFADTSHCLRMARLAVAHVAALVCYIGGIQAVGNGPYLGGLTFVSTCRFLMAGSFGLAC